MSDSLQASAAARRAVRWHEDPRAAARAAGLCYVTDAEPGLTRTRHGRGFAYRDERGRRAGPRQLDRIRALAIPPAWRAVWICPSEDGHLQATGLDDRGRKQYLYHPRWRELRDGATFDRLALVGAALPELRASVAGQLRRRLIDRPRVLAGMTRLLDDTGIRIGNEVYERDNDSVGLATLRWSHVTVDGTVTVLAFPAKSGRRAEFTVHDRPLVRLLRQIEGPRRRRVFVVDGHPLRPEDLNAFLSEVAGTHVTAKDFRTWRGTVTALAHLRALSPAGRPSKRNALGAIDAAAAALGNTRTVARAHYVHPTLIERYLDGTLGDIPAPSPADGLDGDERALIQLLPDLLAPPPPPSGS